MAHPKKNHASTTLDPKAPAKNGFNYKPKFGVIITCDDESHQEKVFNRIKKLGYTAKVVVV